EFPPVQFKLDRHDRARRTPRGVLAGFAVAGNSSDLGFFEYRAIKLHLLLGIIIKPQKWSDTFHAIFLSCCVGPDFSEPSPNTPPIDRRFPTNPASSIRERRQMFYSPLRRPPGCA